MLTKEQLLDLEVPPKLTDITLKVLQEFYDSELTNRTYTYTLRQHKKKDTVTIKIRFFQENMPHLLAIQKIVPREIKYRFEGRKGYESIRDSNITIEKLEAYDEQKPKADKELPKIEKRLTHFYLIPKLMEECSIVKFCSKNVKRGFCQLRSDFILYNEKLGVKLHLGVIDEQGTAYYVPETFIVSSLRERDRNRLTEGQVFMNVIDIDITPLENNNNPC